MQILVFLLTLYLPDASFAKSVNDGVQGAQNNRTTNSNQKELSQDEYQEKHFGIVGDFAGGANSNPSYSDDLDLDTEWNLRLFSFYRFIALPTFESQIRYSFQKVYFQNNSASEYGSQTVSLPLAYYFGRSRLEVSPSFSLETFGNSLFSRNIGGTVSFIQRIGTRYLGLVYYPQRINVVNSDYPYFQGFSHRVEIFYRVLGDQTDFRIGAELQKYVLEDTDDVSLSHYRASPTISWARIWGRWDFRSALQLELRFYRKAINDDIRRRDKSAQLRIDAGYTLGHSIRFFTELQFIRNLSNFDETGTAYTYSQGRGMFGVSVGI